MGHRLGARGAERALVGADRRGIGVAEYGGAALAHRSHLKGHSQKLLERFLGRGGFLGERGEECLTDN